MPDDYQGRLKPLLDRIAPRYRKTAITIGDGWIDLVLELDRSLSLIAPDYRVLQIKEKFGELRFYYALPADADPDLLVAAREWVRAAEDHSTHICEECGRSGELRTERRWVRTLCDIHHTTKRS